MSFVYGQYVFTKIFSQIFNDKTELNIKQTQVLKPYI